MPGLIRGIARTAAIAGTATAVSNRVSRRQYNKWANQGEAAYGPPQQQYAPPPQQYAAPPQQYAAPPQQYAAPPQQYAPPPPAAAADDRIARLKELGALHDQGILTDDEFAREKAKILA